MSPVTLIMDQQAAQFKKKYEVQLLSDQKQSCNLQLGGMKMGYSSEFCKGYMENN